MAFVSRHIDTGSLIGSWPIIPSISGSDPVLIPRTMKSQASIIGTMREPVAGYDVSGRSFILNVDGSDKVISFSYPGYLSLSEVISQINTAVGATVAFNNNGFLKLQSPTAGDTSYLKIEADPSSSPTDVLSSLGLFPEVESHAGDLMGAAHIDPDRQVALPDQMTMAEGETFEARVFNRAIAQLSINNDRNEGLLSKKRVATRDTLSVPSYTKPGTVDGVQLSGGKLVYVGKTSTPPVSPNLEKLFAILDSEGREFTKDVYVPVTVGYTGDFSVVPATYGGTARQWVTCSGISSATEDGNYYILTYGFTGGAAVLNGKPLKILAISGTTGADIENIDPATGNFVFSTDTGITVYVVRRERFRVMVDGVYENVAAAEAGTPRLENNPVTKRSSVFVSGVTMGNRLTCAGEDFTSAPAVQVGDVVTLTGSAVYSPFSNDGIYRVAEVVDKETLKVVAADWGAALLTPVAVGFGTIDITTDGYFVLDPFLRLAASTSLYAQPVNGEALEVAYLSGTTIRDATDNDPALFQGDVRFTQESDDTVTRAITRMWGQSATSLDSVLYGDYRINLESLDKRLNTEHYTFGEELNVPSGLPSVWGRHRDIHADSLNIDYYQQGHSSTPYNSIYSRHLSVTGGPSVVAGCLSLEVEAGGLLDERIGWQVNTGLHGGSAGANWTAYDVGTITCGTTFGSESFKGFRLASQIVPISNIYPQVYGLYVSPTWYVDPSVTNDNGVYGVYAHLHPDYTSCSGAPKPYRAGHFETIFDAFTTGTGEEATGVFARAALSSFFSTGVRKCSYVQAGWFQSDVSTAGGGSVITAQYGVRVENKHRGNTSTLSNLYGVHISTTLNDGATSSVTNAYAFYNNGVQGATNNWALWSGSGKIYAADTLSVSNAHYEFATLTNSVTGSTSSNYVRGLVITSNDGRTSGSNGISTGLYVNAVATAGASSITALMGAQINGKIDSGSAATVSGLYGLITALSLNSSSHTVNQTVGVSVQSWAPVNANASTDYSAIRTQAATATGASSIRRAIYVEPLSGTASASYGLYVGNVSGASNNYAIHTSLGTVHFEDRIEDIFTANLTSDVDYTAIDLSPTCAGAGYGKIFTGASINAVDNRSTGGSGSVVGLYVKARTTNATGTSVYGARIFAEVAGLSSYTYSAVGLDVNLSSTITEYLLSFTGVNISGWAYNNATTAAVFKGINIAATSAVNASGSYKRGINIESISGGADDHTGVYIANVSGATNNYAIYTNAGIVRFGGVLRMPVMSAPSSGQVGDMYVATGGVLKICTNAGTPGTWVSVGAQT